MVPSTHHCQMEDKMKLAKLFLLVVVLFAAVFAFAPASEAGPKGPTIVDVALQVNEATGEFDTLIAAVLAADPAVVATLSGNGQHTVFAPTDAAFADLGLTPDNVGSLDQAFLTQVLLYHVANGRRDAADIVSSSQVRTLQRGFLQQDSGVLTDNLGRDAQIILTDVPAANGLIHVIDAVVLPYAP